MPQSDLNMLEQIAQDLIDAQGKDITITGISRDCKCYEDGCRYTEDTPVSFKIERLEIDKNGRVCYFKQGEKELSGAYPFEKLLELSINGKTIMSLNEILKKKIRSY